MNTKPGDYIRECFAGIDRNNPMLRAELGRPRLVIAIDDRNRALVPLGLGTHRPVRSWVRCPAPKSL